MLGAAIFVLPIQTWRDQGDDLTERQAQLDELEKVNVELAAEVDRLQTDDGIREAAREEIGFVEAGEERSSILPLPAAADRSPRRLAVQRRHEHHRGPPGWARDPTAAD